MYYSPMDTYLSSLVGLDRFWSLVESGYISMRMHSDDEELAEHEGYSKQSRTELELRKVRANKLVNEPAVLASLAERITVREELQAIARSEGLQPQRLRKSLVPHFAQLARPKTGVHSAHRKRN